MGSVLFVEARFGLTLPCCRIFCEQLRNGITTVSDQEARNALFISHATPEDDAFVRWLGAKLTAIGYEVWADIFGLRGGADWAREIEGALQNRAIKMLLVCTPEGLEKQGVRNEIEIASQLAKDIGDREFIIPLRLKPYHPHFRIAQAQYVDFSRSWANGLAELMGLLADNKAIPRMAFRPMDKWNATQKIGAAKLVRKKEYLLSNWLTFRRLPRTVNYCEPPSGFLLERFQSRALHKWPAIPFRAGVITFSSPDGQGMIAPDLPAKKIADIETEKFLDHGWENLGITAFEARRQFTDLGNQAFEAFLHERKLSFQEGSGGRRSWWGDIRTAPTRKVSFRWPHYSGLRQIVGQSGKRGVFWHYAINGHVRLSPIRHLRLSGRLVFSENGLNAIEDPSRSHRLRRSFAKSWRNARWRDMMLAFLWWLSDGGDEISLKVGEREELALTLPPIAFKSNFSVNTLQEAAPDEDDPDAELDDWEDSLDEDVAERAAI